jgi:transposase
MIDGSVIRAHQHAAGAIGGQDNEALGRSAGGFSTKIHVKVDALGLPLKFILTGGQTQEITVATLLVNNEFSQYLLADRGYDSNDFRNNIKDNGIQPVIPSKKNRLVPIEHDRHIYKERNIVERFFSRIKQFRRIATRYDKTAAMFMGSLVIIGIILWLK